MAANGGKKPTGELLAALTGLEWDSPGGRIRMALGDGHQAIQDRRSAAPTTAPKTGRPRRHPSLPGRVRQSAAEREVGGLDQGGLSRAKCN